MTSVRRAAWWVAALALLAACAEPAPSESVAAPTATAAPRSHPPSTATPAVTPLPSPSPSTVPTPVPVSDEPPPIALELVVGGLADPTGIATVPDGRLIVHERAGRAIVVDPATGRTDVALDIGDRVLAGGERGLLGLALAPDWPADSAVYVHYSDADGDTVVSAFTTASAEPLRIDPASERVLLTQDQPYGNHNGGQLAFGPDGYLYVGLGDGGSGGDPQGHGQNPRTLLGSVLRIDVGRIADDGNDAPAFAIPSDNPFADGTVAAPEVFAFGLRNPWRFSFDRATGELWIADVGQGSWEEVNRLDPSTDAGANFGWNVAEGAHCYRVAGCSTDGMVAPVAEYGHDRGCSVTGGFVYRGRAIEGLAGWYLFSDYCSGILFGVPSDTDGSNLEPRQLLATGRNVVAFGEDADGELYLVDIGSGELVRVVAGD